MFCRKSHLNQSDHSQNMKPKAKKITEVWVEKSTLCTIQVPPKHDRRVTSQVGENSKSLSIEERQRYESLFIAQGFCFVTILTFIET